MGDPQEALAELFLGVVTGAPARPTLKQLGECEAGLSRAFERAGRSADQVFEAAPTEALVAACSRWWSGRTPHEFRLLIASELVERRGYHTQLIDAVRTLDGKDLLERAARLDRAWRSDNLDTEDVLRAVKPGGYLVSDNCVAVAYQMTAPVAHGPEAPTVRPCLADAAFEALLEWRHRDGLLGRVRGWGLDDDTAHEIYQQLVLDFLKNHLSGFKPEQQTFGPYLRGAAWNKREDLRRRSARRGPTAPLDELNEPPAADGDRARLEAFDLIHAALPLLKADNPEQHDALLLQNEGLSIQEIAAAQGTPAGTAGVRVKRARDKLRLIVEKLLDGRGDACTTGS